VLDLAQPLPETQSGIEQSQHSSQLDVLQEWWLSLFELDVAQPLPETQPVIGQSHHNSQLDVLQEVHHAVNCHELLENLLMHQCATKLPQ
jgi:hypothetical protein